MRSDELQIHASQRYLLSLYELDDSFSCDCGLTMSSCDKPEVTDLLVERSFHVCAYVIATSFPRSVCRTFLSLCHVQCSFYHNSTVQLSKALHIARCAIFDSPFTTESAVLYVLAIESWVESTWICQCRYVHLCLIVSSHLQCHFRTNLSDSLTAWKPWDATAQSEEVCPRKPCGAG